jgi:hypothetical protein
LPAPHCQLRSHPQSSGGHLPQSNRERPRQTSKPHKNLNIRHRQTTSNPGHHAETTPKNIQPNGRIPTAGNFSLVGRPTVGNAR